MDLSLLRRHAVPMLSLAAIGLVVGLYAGTATSASSADPQTPVPIALPAGETSLGVDAVEASAIAIADALEAVPLAPGAPDGCPRDLLAVSWTEPGPEYGHGAYVPPIGPAPDDTVTEVNGVVICTGHPYAFMGFEAAYQSGRWEVYAVPSIDGDHSEEDLAEVALDAEQSAPDAPPVPQPPPSAQTLAASGPIEGYAAYDPQRICDPTAKPGSLALRNLVLDRYPGTRNLGISRACNVGGRSEHKEGRALDWGVHVSRPAEKAAADSFITQLLATDAEGNRHALARRMGVMYIIWDRQIWTAYRSPDTWRPYTGASPHIDHVHISLSWGGAMARTSFWSGTVDTTLAIASHTVSGLPGGGTVASRPSSEAGERTARRGSREDLAAQDSERADRKAARRAARAAVEAEARAAREAERAERKAERQAERQAERDERKRVEQEARRQREADREVARAERKATEAQRRADRAAAEAQRRADKAQAKEQARAERRESEAQRRAAAEAAKAAERQRRADEKAEREAAKQAERDRRADEKAQREAAKQAERDRRAEERAQREAAKQPAPAPEPPPPPPEPESPPPPESAPPPDG